MPLESSNGLISLDGVVEQTSLSGLHWEANPISVAESDAGVFVANSSGPCLTDIVTHDSAFRYDQYGIHIGQVDRLTFFGPCDRTIVGHFVDCRRGSPTLNHTERLVYRPDPARKLIIDRGIAHTFDGLEDVVTRDEPIWFMAESNPDYSMGSDVVNFPRNAGALDAPVVMPNDLPIPDECYRYITSRQHEIFKDAIPTYPVRFRVRLDGEARYVVAVPLAAKRFAHEPAFEEYPPLPIGDLGWGRNLVAASGGDSFYLVENPGSVTVGILFLELPGADLVFRVHSSPVRLTLLGDPRTHVEAHFRDGRVARTAQAQVVVRPDPHRHLFVPAGIAYAFRGSGELTVRIEAVTTDGVEMVQDSDAAPRLFHLDREAAPTAGSTPTYR